MRIGRWAFFISSLRAQGRVSGSASLGVGSWYGEVVDDDAIAAGYGATASHPIAKGVKDFTIPKEEIYMEPFDVPEPQVLVFRSKWDSGEEFRSGCVRTAGKGKVFYFRPGHETFPVYNQPEVVKILTNAAFWAGTKNGKDARP